jgi:hypothetical protein
MSSLSIRTSWLVLLSCSFAANVQAASSKPALHWSRAENAADCVDPRTLAELVETYTGPVLVAPASADTSIEGAIERISPEEFRMRVSVTVTRGRPAGQRVLTLPATDCRKLDGAIAFVIATTLDPDLGANALPAELSWLGSETPAADQLRDEVATAPAPELRPRPQPSAAAAVASSDASAPPTQAGEESPVKAERGVWELGIALAAGTGVVPKANAGGLVTLARSLGSAFALTLQLRGNSSIGGFDVSAGRTIGVETFGGALLACGRTSRLHAFGAQACLGPEVGFFRAHGSGFSGAHAVVQPVYGGHLKLEVRYEVADQLAITAAGLFGLGFRRPFVTYQYLQEQPTVFRSELYSIQGALGLMRSF